MEIVENNKQKQVIYTLAIIVLFIVAWLCVTGILQLSGAFLAGADFFNTEILTPKQNAIIYLASLIGSFLTVYVFRRYVNHKSFISLGFSFRKRLPDLLIGSAIGCLIMIAGFLILTSVDQIAVESVSVNISDLLWSLMLFACVSVLEEMVSRGFILGNLMDCMNRHAALLLSSLLFSLTHLFNPNTALLPMFNLFLAGILLGSAYIYTRNLWFAIGMHLFWNFVQGPILGFKVSGTSTSTLVKLHYPENNSVNGGEFGFEGSVVCTIFMLIAITIIMWYYEIYKPRSNG